MVSGAFLTYKTKRDKNCPVCGKKQQKDKKQVKSEISKKELDKFIDNIEGNGDIK
jgi:hypothetical protein